MPHNMIDVETMELYKRMPINEYKDTGHHQDEFCSNCAQNEYEDVLRNVTTRKKKTKNYERHCPSCHCPLERSFSRRFSPSSKPRANAGNMEIMLNQYERAEPINSTIKKTQSSPFSQKVYWHGCQMNSRYPKASLQNRRQRRTEIDRYPLRIRADAMNSELTNEDIEAYSKYAQSIPVKSSLKKHGHCRKPEGSPNEQEYSDADSELSAKCTSHIRQSRKSRVPNPGLRHHCVGGYAEYVAEMRNESDVELRQNDCRMRDCQEMRKVVLEFEDERLKRGDAETATISDDDKRPGKRKLGIAKMTKQGKLNDSIPYRVTNKPSMLIKESINEPAKEFALNTSAHLTKLDLSTTKTRILESIDHVLGTIDDTKNNTPTQQEQTDQETLEKISRELQENGWQLLFNALTIHRNMTDSSKRTIRLECLNHIRQQLDKLYALESTLDNCSPKLQSNHDTSYIEENQPLQQSLEQKVVDS